MVDSPSTLSGGSGLGARLEALGRSLGAREVAHADGLAQARSLLDALRGEVAAGLARFHATAAEAGAPHLQVALSDVRIDEKHLRAVEFELSRGRHRAIVVGKSRGEITLVGPFRAGKDEGPCKSVPFGAPEKLDAAVGDFLEAFLEQAASP